MSEKEKVVHVETKEELGGYTTTVVTDQGNVHTGRDHWFNHPFGGDATPERSVRDALRKVND